MKHSIRILVFASVLAFSHLILAQQGQADPIVQAIAGRWVQVSGGTGSIWEVAPSSEDARFYVYQGAVTFRPFPRAGYDGSSLMGCQQVTIHLERIGNKSFRGQCDFSAYLHVTFTIRLSADGQSIHVLEGGLSTGGTNVQREAYLIRSLSAIPSGLPFQSCIARPGWVTECK